jgi:SEC-C motif-containing protein
MARCTCGGERPFKRCCEPLLRGERQAAGPEELVRARYVAFTRAEADFLLQTNHPRTACRFDPAENLAWARTARWLGLEIRAVRTGRDPDVAFVEFVANYEQDGMKRRHHEVSELRREDGRWWFWDGVPAGTGVV